MTLLPVNSAKAVGLLYPDSAVAVVDTEADQFPADHVEGHLRGIVEDFHFELLAERNAAEFVRGSW